MSMEIAKSHYISLRRYLYQQLQREKQGVSTQRRSAREKLVRLTQQQFQELSTDVYDELTRREANDPQVPFLAVKDEFHPKRNQARQKLATLPKTRFKDLASDVYAELDRRYTHFSGETGSIASTGQAASNSTGSLPWNAANNNNNSSADAVNGARIRNSEASTTAAPSPPNSNRSNRHVESNLARGSVDVPGPMGSTQGVVVPERAEAIIITEKPLDYTVHAATDASGQALNLDSLDDLMQEMEGMVKKQQKRDGVDDEADRGGSDGALLNGEPAAYDNRDSINTVASRMKESYELQLKMMQQHIQDLEMRLDATMDDASASRLRRLEDDLAHHQELNNRLQADLSRLQLDNRTLQEELHSQKKSSGSLREESDALLASIRELSLKNEEISNERSEYDATIKELNTENKTLRSRLEESRRELRAIKATSTYIRENPKNDFAEQKLLTPVENGILEQSHVTAFQLGIDSLLRAIRSETANQSLLAMKAVVMACKGLLQDVEIYERSNRPGPDRTPLQAMRARLGASLNVLVTAARNHVTAGGVSPPGIVDGAASDVTGVVVELVRMLRIDATTAKSAGHGSSLSTIDEANTSVVSHGGGGGYGSDIAAAYETRSNGTNSHNVSRSGSIQSSGPLFRPTSNISPQSSQAHLSVYDLDDLKVFLEQRTDEIVQSIHNLLGLIRAPRADAQELSSTVQSIYDTVNGVIVSSRRTLNNPSGAAFRMEGEQILANLDQSNVRLCELRETYPLNGPADKPAKQALASAAFEIAKHTKELVALIDDSGSE